MNDQPSAENSLPRPGESPSPRRRWWLLGAALLALSILFPVSCSSTGGGGTFVFSFGSVRVETHEDADGKRTTKVRTGTAVFQGE